MVPSVPPCWHSPSRSPALGAHVVRAATPVQSRMAIQRLMLGLPRSFLTPTCSRRCETPSLTCGQQLNAQRKCGTAPTLQNCNEESLVRSCVLWGRIALDGLFFYFWFCFVLILKIHCWSSWLSCLEMRGCHMDCCFCSG